MATGYDSPRDWFRNELRNFFQDFASPSYGRGRGRARRGQRTAGVFPPVNIYDDGEAFRVRAELPGVDRDDLEINAKGDEIVIRGERTVAPPKEGADWHRRERQSGEFRRTVTLPQPVNPDKVTANLKLGVLDVYAPRAEETEPKKIEIQ